MGDLDVPLLGELADLVSDLVGGGLEPCWRSSGVRNGRRGDTLSLGVKTGMMLEFEIAKHQESDAGYPGPSDWRCHEGR